MRALRFGGRSEPLTLPDQFPFALSYKVYIQLASPNHCAVQPPSITNSLPVMNDDSSEARNSTP